MNDILRLSPLIILVIFLLLFLPPDKESKRETRRKRQTGYLLPNGMIHCNGKEITPAEAHKKKVAILGYFEPKPEPKKQRRWMI
jgi:hypothetical protein